VISEYRRTLRTSVLVEYWEPQRNPCLGLFGGLETTAVHPTENSSTSGILQTNYPLSHPI